MTKKLLKLLKTLKFIHNSSQRKSFIFKLKTKIFSSWISIEKYLQVISKLKKKKETRKRKILKYFCTIYFSMQKVAM